MSKDLAELWDRQKDESEQAYFAFCVYRDQESPRGTARVVSELGKSKTLIHRWSSRWYWVERCRAWDRYREEQTRRESIKETRAMARRQARDAHAFQLVLIAPVEATLKKLNDPTQRAALDALPLGDLIALSTLTARLFAPIARAEREARGAPVQDLTQFLDEDTGDVVAAPPPRDTYEWMRSALAALEQATNGRLALPPGGEA